MDNNNSKKENRSMYLYTALIFVVALLLILLAFFSQTNVSKLGKRAEEFATPAPTSVATTEPDELAKVSNMAAELDAQNKELSQQIAVYDNLLSANAHLKNGNITDAETIFLTIDETSLTDNQRILYEEIKTKINEGKEQ